MSESNIAFASNVYVVKDGNKLADHAFMAKVVDPGAIREIAKLLPKDGMGRVKFPSPLQQKIYEYSTPCAYGNGDYTHGVIMENGEPICVNTCEVIGCPHFKSCSSADDYRRIVRTHSVSQNEYVVEGEVEEDDLFDVELPVKPKRFALAKTKKRYVTEELKQTIRTNDELTWGVRGFWRTLWDGRQVWVRPHHRHHDEENIEVSQIRKVYKKIVYRFANAKQLEKFKKFLHIAHERAKARNGLQNVIENEVNTYQLQHIIPIDSAKELINSSLSSRILVNAGPGTGKTHTVIERLKYIVNAQEDIDPESVLILCFSRAAVKVIRDRLSVAIESGEISAFAKKYTVSTFDSFATWYLMQIDPRRNLTYNSYDDRIRLFIEEYEKDTKILNESLNYLIVDEVQDLVGIRARLVQSLLKNIDCGFLLLGDECQAIYDYQITSDNDLNAAGLYEWMEKSFGENLEEYELTRDFRHEQVFGGTFSPLRQAMLHRPFAVQREELNKLFKHYDMPELSTENIIECCSIGDGKRAVLSWSNGDAYRQSQELYLSNSRIRHTILTGSRRLYLRKELALILSNYISREITKREFIDTATACGIDKNIAMLLWDGMVYTVGNDDDNIVLDDLRRALINERRIDDVLISSDNADVIISTIHKAKGKEFDSVLVNQSGSINNSDDIKVYYVAVTRAKKDLVIKRHRSSHIDKQTEQGRYIELSNNKIKRIELGIDGDIDPIGFVSTKIPGMDAEARQKYIRENVRVGDTIKISKYKGVYLIVHNGHFIGKLNDYALSQGYIQYYPSGKYYQHRFDKYTDFTELYVKDIVSIVNNAINENIAEPFNKSGFWLGIEFCGYAKPLEE